MKKPILLFIALLFLVVSADANYYGVIARKNAVVASVTLDAVSEAVSVAWGSSIVWEHVIAANSNKVLIVVASSSNGSDDWQTCVWDSGGGSELALTKLTSQTSDNSYLTMFYSATEPDAGTKDITCTAAGSSTLIAFGMSIYNAEYATNEDGSAATGSGVTSISDVLTTNTANSWVVTGGWHYDNEELDTNNGETVRNWDGEGGFASGIATELIAATGAQTFSWDDVEAGTNASFMIVMAEFKPK